MPANTRDGLPFLLTTIWCLTACGVAGDAASRVPDGYPTSYARTIAGAEREAGLIIWSATDRRQVRELLAGFSALHPKITVDYRELPSRQLHDRFIASARRGRVTADLLWSSAMDLQIKLVNDGYAQSYGSPEKVRLPDWANWKDQAWGITAEPIVMIHNRRLLSPAAMPRDHVAFARMLEAPGAAFKGRVATYDPATSAVGFLYLFQDELASRHVWRTVRSMGANAVRLFSTTEGIIDDVASGRSVVGYNVVGSYAVDEIRRHPQLAVSLPRDYSLLMSRIAMIPEQAPHPNAARLFLDYMLSREGQRHLTAHSMPSVRDDVPKPDLLPDAGGSMRAIRVGPALLIPQDRLTRRRFLRQWDREILAGAGADAHQTAERRKSSGGDETTVDARGL